MQIYKNFKKVISFKLSFQIVCNGNYFDNPFKLKTPTKGIKVTKTI